MDGEAGAREGRREGGEKMEEGEGAEKVIDSG